MKSKIAIKQSTINGLIMVFFFVIAGLLIGSIVYMRSSIQAEQAAEQRRTEFKQLGINLADASDYLTDEARKYSITTDLVHLQRYWKEINNTKTRDKVIEKLRELESPEEELELLAKAKQHSDALVDTERRSMRLVLEALDLDQSKMVPEIASFQLNTEDKKLSKIGKLNQAREIMFDAKYDSDKKDIMDPIAKFQEVMNARLEAELQTARADTSNAAVVQIILACIIICAIALLIRTLFKYVTNPINSYTKLLKDFSVEEDEFNLIPQGTLELQHLANTFNDLYTSFHDELEKRMEAESTMRAAKEEAELANNAKSEFLASMSHEIRTPLNTIIGYQYLLNKTSQDLKQKEYCDKIGIVANNLLGLINGILDFSKIEAGKMLLENIEFNIVTAVNDIYSMVAIEANKKGLELVLHMNEAIQAEVYGDVTRLKQVMLNLLYNAIKFTDKGSIILSLDYKIKDTDKVSIVLSVTDTGIGISQEQVNIIFDNFTQGDASTTRKYGGTGLGLAICKKIAELMSGDISVQSEQGKGSCFTFTADFQIVSGSEILNEEKESNILDIAFTDKKILLVEDNEINLQMTEEILNSMGFQTYTAISGMSAIEHVDKYLFDIILMDIRMPEMDGYDTTGFIRLMKNGQKPAIIALTADAVDGVEEKARRAGMDGYMTKPLNPNKLSQIIKNYIITEYKQFEKTETSKGEFNFRNSKVEHNSLFENGIEKLGGNKPRYIEILDSFVVNHRNDGKELLLLFESNNLNELGNLVHKLKGIFGGFGADYLFERCKTLELFIKSNMPRKQIRNKIDEIKYELDNFCLEAVSFIEANRPAKADLPNNENNFEEIIIKLKNYLAIADSEAKDYFLSNSQYIKTKLHNETFDKLKKSIMEFDFEQAESFLACVSDANSYNTYI